MLYQALCSGEQLKNVTIKQYRIDPSGVEEHYFSITLEDAIIVQVAPYIPVAFLAENEPFRHMEKVSFTYSKIKWKHEVDNKESEDSWKIPV
jgi:type VI secretion system secreted protein Hcp